VDHHPVMMIRAECGPAPEMRRTVITRIGQLASDAGAAEETIRRVEEAVEHVFDIGPDPVTAGPCEVEVWRAPGRFEIRFRWPHAPIEPKGRLPITDHTLTLADEVTVSTEAEVIAVLIYRL
jgi:hypothetical protein